ncbi:MAG TPA: phosphoribosylanthranilate isomerase [Hyphomicrobiales bacterium]|nr:phosphoribosylanthranilate isomerase [Kaistiaceae bacterium]HQF31537.1 phosphoribosylanthranilate isomerase [Hyphomicrobiales bacterium]
MGFKVKICGINSAVALDAALEAGADAVGFVFFEKSPRHIGLEDARAFADFAEARAEKVALTVDADDATLAAIVAALRPDVLQLHGHETPARIAEIRARFGLPVMKALGIATRQDLESVPAFAAVADRLLFDAKPPKGATRPGGLGVPFDWTLIAGLDVGRPFMLSGGLDPDNVAEAIRLTRPPGVDVSSGVESAPGIKDPDLIERFVAEARRAAAEIGQTSKDERVSS